MMAELFHFRDRRDRPFESELRDCIRKSCAGAVGAEWIINDIKPRVEGFYSEFDIEIPAEILRVVCERMNAALYQMILLEAELYGAKFLS
jgi:RNase P/RNase MRP subunit POP5